MKRIICGIALALLAAFPMADAKAQQTKLLTADKHNEYGLVYSLPVTALRIDVTAKQTVRRTGPYRQYAKRYIGTADVVEQDGETWTIESVKVTSYGVPDADARYLMQLKPGALTSVCVDNDGMLLAINKEVSASAMPELPEDGVLAIPDIKEYLQYVDEDFLASQSSAKQAQMLAESLMEIRDSKVSLSRGTAETMPTDGRQLELMLASLRHQEESITAAFTGAEASRTVSRSYTFTPGDDGRFVLFRMSDFSGFRDADDYSGDPVYIKVKTTRQGELPVDSKGEEKKIPKDGVMYNLPGAARISLSLSGRTLYDAEMDFAQYGVSFGLAPHLFSDKKERSFAIFNPATGALVEIASEAAVEQ